MSSNQPPQTLTHADLLTALTNVPPLLLDGVALLRESRATGRLPSDRQRQIDATQELVAYTGACGRTAELLRALQPVPASEQALVEGYPL